METPDSSIHSAGDLPQRIVPLRLMEDLFKIAATMHRSLIMRSEMSWPDPPNPTGHPLSASEPSRRSRHKSASPTGHPRNPFPCSTPNAAFPDPPGQVGNERYCIESEFHSPPGFLQPSEVASGLGRRTKSNASVCRTWTRFLVLCAWFWVTSIASGQIRRGSCSIPFPAGDIPVQQFVRIQPTFPYVDA